MIKNKNATVLIYTLILVNIALIMALLVFNNASLFFINNEIQLIEKKLSSNILHKGNLFIKYDKTLNSNGSGFIDNVSCPRNVIMSGSTIRQIITSSLTYSGSVFCSGTYISKKFSIFFNEDLTGFTGASYDGNNISLTSGVGNTTFSDSDNTLMSFSTSGLSSLDKIDDDFNSDNYSVFSTGSIYYPDNFQDDDNKARKLIYSYISPSSGFINIFWNNAKTNSFIDANTNNNDNLNVKLGNVGSGYLLLDVDKSFSLKLIKFDRASYSDTNELITLEVLSGSNLSPSIGYIKSISGALSLGSTKTGNEYVFDFTNNDYALFISNTGTGTLFSNLTGETLSGTGIYINPIDDSEDNIIKFLGNDIIIDNEGRFIKNQFEIVGLK